MLNVRRLCVVVDSLISAAKVCDSVISAWCWPGGIKVGRWNERVRAKRCDVMQPRPQGFSFKKWVGREKALASAGHLHSLSIPEKLIYMHPAGLNRELAMAKVSLIEYVQYCNLIVAKTVEYRHNFTAHLWDHWTLWLNSRWSWVTVSLLLKLPV